MNGYIFSENARLTAESNVDNMRSEWATVEQNTATCPFMLLNLKRKSVVTLRNRNVTADIDMHCK